MEIMEDGNLVDRVRILLQRDMEYYQEKQTVLREPLCIEVCGGKLDFPRHASFAAIKIVTWWEAEFTAAFKHASGLSATSNLDTIAESGGVIKNSQPSEFVVLAVDTSEQLLEHLHALTQEALDHADLTVLTATLGAAALVRNCLWCYNQRMKCEVPARSSNELHNCFKSYQQKTEALAERLLDLHCRLISLYILNEADSLNWQNRKPFFEKERCSFVIQMWWLYMQGTREDLWNTVPPKMAQRVFSGMLNESLTIITARCIHGRPSLARSEQFWADAFNVLCCTAHLALGACTSGREVAGFHASKLSVTARDIHAKCSELLVCLLLRGAPLKILYQVFRDGFGNLMTPLSQDKPVSWFIISAPHLLASPSEAEKDLEMLQDGRAIALEINVLKSQPQPNWPQIIKTLLMKKCKVSALLIGEFLHQYISYETNHTAIKKPDDMKNIQEKEGCGGFLCAGSTCSQSVGTPALALYSLTYISVVAAMNSTNIFVPALQRDPNWSNFLDRQQVWNQNRPPWLDALLTPLHPMMVPIVETLLEAAKTGASIYQAMSLVLACFNELYICTPTGLLRTALMMNENIPAHCHPIGNSVLLQMLCASLYSVLLEVSNEVNITSYPTNSMRPSCTVSSFDPHNKPASATALAEALCSIDEDDKHTLQIDALLNLIKESIASEDVILDNIDLESVPLVAEILADELLFTSTGRRSLKVAHECLVHATDWILDGLGIVEERPPIFSAIPTEIAPATTPLLHIMFHIGHRAFDQLLIGYIEADWTKLLKIPLTITMDRVHNQILTRPEFKDTAQLTPDEREAADAVKQLCVTEKYTRHI